jgi:hypothetical protein
LKINPWWKIREICRLCASVARPSSSSTEASSWLHISSPLIKVYRQLANLKGLLDESTGGLGVYDIDSDSEDLYGRMTSSLESKEDISSLNDIFYEKVRPRITAIRFEVASCTYHKSFLLCEI